MLNREVEKNAPPRSLNVSSQPEYTRRDKEFSIYAIYLLRRLLAVADLEYTISLPNRELMEEIVSGKSIRTLARYRNCSIETIRNYVKEALELIDQKIELWENANTILLELREELRQEQENSLLKDQEIERLKQTIFRYRNGISQIEKILKDQNEWEEQSNHGIIKLDESTKQVLKNSVKDINLTSHIAGKLIAQNIYTVFDLVNHSEDELYQIKGITFNVIKLIKSKLRLLGLELGSDIRWVSAVDEYYIYPRKN